MENKACYKIHCCDQNDDVVDIFSSNHHDIAAEYSKIDYNNEDWQKFYRSLCFLVQIESLLYGSLQLNMKDINEKIVSEIDKMEERLEARDKAKEN